MRAAITRTRPKHPPGGRAVYSNYGMGLLGYALAQRAGSSYGTLCANASPARWVSETPTSTLPARSPGHTALGRPTSPWQLAELAGAGGLRSTATDLVAYLALHAPGASGPLADAARETRRPRAKLGAGADRARVDHRAGQPRPAGVSTAHEVVLHEGGTGGFRTFAAVVPATGTAVVVLANQARGVGRLAMQVLRETA